MKKAAMWFSRHVPTAIQLEEIEDMGFELKAVEIGISFGLKSLESPQSVWDCDEGINALRVATGAVACFGTFPAPLRAFWVHNGTFIPCYEAWNIQRSIDGGKPTFAHKEWVRTV